jgi:uncharacterized membrane protein
MKNSLSIPYHKFFFLRSAIDRLLLLNMLFSCALVVARISHTHKLTFIFLFWNLFLALLPWCLSKWISENLKRVKSRSVFVMSFLVWLALIPNSFYILTDLYHLGDAYNDYLVPKWYDLAMILSFAWNGLILGILSVRQMEKNLQQHFSLKKEWWFLFPVMWMNALGVYIGRYMRFNSWDIITDPFQLVRDMTVILLHPVTFRYAWGMIFSFSILFSFFYLTLKRVSKGLR